MRGYGRLARIRLSPPDGWKANCVVLRIRASSAISFRSGPPQRHHPPHAPQNPLTHPPPTHTPTPTPTHTRPSHPPPGIRGPRPPDVGNSTRCSMYMRPPSFPVISICASGGSSSVGLSGFLFRNPCKSGNYLDIYQYIESGSLLFLSPGRLSNGGL